MISTKCVIIGAGAAGITCALYLKRANVPFVWLDKGAPGGKLLNIHEIANYPGLPVVSGTELADKLLESAAAFGANPDYGDVMSISKKDNLFVVHTDDETYETPTVLVATGLSFVPTIKGEKDKVGKGISYCATCDGPIYRGKTVAVYGKGYRALNEASYLSMLCEKVLMINPEGSFEGGEALLETIKNEKNVEVLLNTKVKEIKGSAFVEGIVLENQDGEKEEKVEALFPLLGERSATEFLSPLGLKMEKGFIPVDEHMESEIPGLYAAGDIVKKDLRQVVTACGDGATASSSIIRYLKKFPN